MQRTRLHLSSQHLCSRAQSGGAGTGQPHKDIPSQHTGPGCVSPRGEGAPRVVPRPTQALGDTCNTKTLLSCPVHGPRCPLLYGCGRGWECPSTWPQQHSSSSTRWKKGSAQRRISSIFHSLPHLRRRTRRRGGGREAGNLSETLNYKPEARRAGRHQPVPHTPRTLSPVPLRCYRGKCQEEQNTRAARSPRHQPRQWAAFTLGDINSPWQAAEEWQQAQGLPSGQHGCPHKERSVRVPVHACARACARGGLPARRLTASAAGTLSGARKSRQAQKWEQTGKKRRTRAGNAELDGEQESRRREESKAQLVKAHRDLTTQPKRQPAAGEGESQRCPS
ncbi:uncharacterized protein LOC135329525 [Dromaius novaehollandiae]|uniref:uncharacterized protein LOC135329525 n=1 Tax=Dromaius novaehollandiae TaxID=8790 RepID=UPI00311FC750